MWEPMRYLILIKLKLTFIPKQEPALSMLLKGFKWTTATTFNQGTQTCKIQVLDTNNKPVSGGTAILTVDSKNYTATTTSDGYATFKASFPVGNYSVSYTFNGDNLNAPSSGSTALTVKKINSIFINDK